MVNYSKELEKIIAVPENSGKRLVLHSCCAPCSSYCLLYLRKYFRISVIYYNPNITEDAEYQKRLKEQLRLIEIFNSKADLDGAYKIDVIETDYNPGCFFEAVRGYENLGEGSKRCEKCFELRLTRTAEAAADIKADYFTTTLTVSPLKNARLINEIGMRIGDEKKVAFLPSDFKKKDGYKQTIELSKEYDLYRQDYCGCGFSKRERENFKREQQQQNSENKCELM